ncbi:MAG: hypothetical protein J1F32_01625 [Erysipelotrichales bacterium]|nr:hypothetical protein [Erysipelotrichales bacterium]
MYKIKDNVDLCILENYGFTYDGHYQYWKKNLPDYNARSWNIYYLVIRTSDLIVSLYDNKNIWPYGYLFPTKRDGKPVNVNKKHFKDLIDAGLVEVI